MTTGMKSLNKFCEDNDIGRSYAYGQIKAGKLKAVKVGSNTHITAEAETEWRKSLPSFGAAA
jgi:hypothetical protein